MEVEVAIHDMLQRKYKVLYVGWSDNTQYFTKGI